MRLSILSATCPLGLALLLLLGCSQSSSDVTLAEPLDGSLGSDAASQETDAEVGPDQSTMDSHTHDAAVADVGALDADIADAAIPMDMLASDMLLSDMFVGPTSDSMLPPATCADRPDRSCADICQSLTDCLVGDGCLGIQAPDAEALRASCENTCGFNTSTRAIMCAAESNDCTNILDALYEADQTLNALCNFDDAFTEEQHDACRAICSHTNSCLESSDGSVEPPQACRFQCLSSGNYATVNCITSLPCDDQFESAAQACLQGRRTYPPLVTECVTLCTQLAACEVDRTTIFEGDPGISCTDRCTNQLGTAQEIACVGLEACAVDADLITRCISDNAAAPSCALSCQRILECSSSENPFGVTEASLAACVQQCSATTTASQRQCSFDTACDEGFLDNFNSCSTE